MKRSPLNRHTELKRTPFVRRARRGDKPEVRADWAAAQIQRCACCWAPLDGPGIELHKHHLLTGSKRIDDPRMLLLLCFQWGDFRPRCHDIYHGHRIPKRNGGYWSALTLGHLLVLKAENDQENYDPHWLTKVYGRPLPDPEPLPEEYIRERERWERIAGIN